MMRSDLRLLHLQDGSRRIVEASDVYLLEGARDDTLVRLRGRRVLRDVRSLREIEKVFRASGFVRIHKSFIVNPARAVTLRPRKEGHWELRMTSPVNRVLPVGRQYLKALLKIFGES